MSEEITTCLYREVEHHSPNTGDVMVERIMTVGERPKDFPRFVLFCSANKVGQFKGGIMVDQNKQPITIEHKETITVEGETADEAMLNMDAMVEKGVAECKKQVLAKQLKMIIDMPGPAQQALLGANGARL